MKPKVLVLMSTYNGEQYLEAQVKSILSQKDVEIHLLIRDDGSTDNTVKMLQEYKNKYSNIDWFSGENLKPAKSFIDLLIRCPKKYDYYAFADQDDFWYSDKMIVAIQKLKILKCPSLYCSNALLVDKNLNSLNKLEYNYIPKFTFQRVLISGDIQGATMVMNNKLVQLFENIKMPSYIPMHDYFVAVVCAGVGGNIVFDQQVHMKYRQHGDNVLGIDYSIKGKVKRNLNRILKQNEFLNLEKICNELMKQQNFQFQPDYLKILKLGSTYKESIAKRIKMATLKDLKFQKLNQTISYRLALILGKM